MLFTKRPIDCLTNNIIERLKVGSIERSFDNIVYEINPLNADICDFPFDGDERLFIRRRIFGINDDIVFRLNNCVSVYI